MAKAKQATPSKLRDGSWGARVAGSVAVGDVVTITTKAGKSWDATVSRVLWSDGSVALVATHNDQYDAKVRRDGFRRGGSSRRSGGRYICEECGDWVEPGTSCWETGCTH
jgi:hypothetical protein